MGDILPFHDGANGKSPCHLRFTLSHIHYYNYSLFFCNCSCRHRAFFLDDSITHWFPLSIACIPPWLLTAIVRTPSQLDVAIVCVPLWTSCCSITRLALLKSEHHHIASFSRLNSLILCMTCCIDGCLSPSLLMAFPMTIDALLIVVWDQVLL